MTQPHVVTHEPCLVSKEPSLHNLSCPPSLEAYDNSFSGDEEWSFIEDAIGYSISFRPVIWLQALTVDTGNVLSWLTVSPDFRIETLG